ncbi:unnamed protein product [Moneuplotes crassus]|uniref:histidine kinase n=1 Tax=Euplotes crassus TaxID=5936 RepID=A0AAD1XXL2_EUPCR|nr:unnamed protein product [Moneuplotes crassus]
MEIIQALVERCQKKLRILERLKDLTPLKLYNKINDSCNLCEIDPDAEKIFSDNKKLLSTISEEYSKHRLKVIRTNWKYIIAIMKIIFATLFTIFMFEDYGQSQFRRICMFLMFWFSFLLEYLIYRYKFFARNGAVLIIVILGLMITKTNISLTEFRLYEGFIFHISCCFLLSTCIVSDWKISSIAVILVYSNLYFLLHLYFDDVGVKVKYCIILAMFCFACNAFLTAKAFRKEFMSTFMSKHVSFQFKRVLQCLPEGVTIINEAGDELKFVNQKLKSTFNLDTFYKAESTIEGLEMIKKKIDHDFDKLVTKANSDSLGFKDTQNFEQNILRKFMARIKSKKVEEEKEPGSVILEEKFDEILLPKFLEEERDLCLVTEDNDRSTKVSIKYYTNHLDHQVEYLYRDFIVRTSKINMINEKDGSPTFLQMFIDTTQITLLEEARAQSNYQKQMLSNVSHEFRTPLNAMSISLHLMKDYLEESCAKYHKIASSSCDMLKGLVEDILDFSKIEAGVFETERIKFTFDELFDEINSMFEIQTRMKHLDFVFEADESLLQLNVKSDKQRLKQILMNLVSNSIKFTDRGSIKIELRILAPESRLLAVLVENEDELDMNLASELIDELPVCGILFGNEKYNFNTRPSRFNDMKKSVRRHIRESHQISEMRKFSNLMSEISQRKPDKEDLKGFKKELKLEMSVIDTGIGIPEEDQPSLFTLFGKTSSNHDRNKTGTGLGLTICKKLCEKLGGKISLSSKEGFGTKVTCKFICFY